LASKNKYQDKALQNNPKTDNQLKKEAITLKINLLDIS